MGKMMSTQNSEKNRGNVENLKPFKPGQSGNPGGRPKKKLIDEVLAELLGAKNSADAKRIAKALIRNAASGDSKAAKLIAERTQGKPLQKVEVTGNDGGPVSLVINFKKSNGN